MLLTVVICVDIDFCMFYDANIGERCETVRTWFDRRVNRLHRLHRLFSCQRKLLLPTDYTDYTDYTENKIRALRVIRWQKKK